MFTGLIEKIGEVKSINSHHGDIQAILSIDNDLALTIKEGDSLSVNGVCLTAYNVNKDNFSVDISNETLDTSSLTQLNTGYKVNIETSLSLQDKLGGHLVSGHVDCIAQVIELYEDARSYRLGFKLGNNELSKYIVKKGSICVDGVSLTVNKESKDSFFVNIIPFTWNNTIMKFYKLETVVNIEVDRIALHVEKLLNNKG
ncbi:MAG: riboflavin synthase [Gammaproteobacteria bacterium]|jgi:riboflavin synthase|nr:riboflavin synthase [Gammaproteobacteria bacterium]|tara:strand:- start:531 stop:1130 length:600 start_codon:yes stop_codon:yes gene_type:complete